MKKGTGSWGRGVSISGDISMFQPSRYTKADGYWLASPAGWSSGTIQNPNHYLWLVSGSPSIGESLHSASYGFRPLVCIPKTSI